MFYCSNTESTLLNQSCRTTTRIILTHILSDPSGGVEQRDIVGAGSGNLLDLVKAAGKKVDAGHSYEEEPCDFEYGGSHVHYRVVLRSPGKGSPSLAFAQRLLRGKGGRVLSLLRLLSTKLTRLS